MDEHHLSGILSLRSRLTGKHLTSSLTLPPTPVINDASPAEMWPVQETSDPLAAQGLLYIPDLGDNDLPTWLKLPDIVDFHSEHLRLDNLKEEPLPSLNAQFLKLDVETIPLPPLESSAASSADSEDETSTKQKSVTAHNLEDIWVLPDVARRKDQNCLLGWDNFVDEDHAEPPSAYLSEEGGEVFSLLWHQSVRKTGVPTIKFAQPNIFLDALFELGLGRDSQCFRFDEQNRCTSTTEDQFTLPGLTTDSVKSVIVQFERSGTQWRQLRTFVDTTFSSRLSSPSTTVAFASCVQSVLARSEKSLVDEKTDIVSLMHLQERFQDSQIFLTSLLGLLPSFEGDSFSIDDFVDVVQQQQILIPSTSLVLQEICRRVLKPLLRDLDASIGLKSPQQSSMASTDYLPGELSSLVADSKEALQLLCNNAEDHSLIKQQASAAIESHLEVEVAFSWSDIERVQQKAFEYEAALRAAVTGAFTPNIGMEVWATKETRSIKIQDPFCLDLAIFKTQDKASTDHLESLNEIPDTDSLSEAVGLGLHPVPVATNSLEVHIKHSMTMSMSPVIEAQHRLLSYSAHELLFQQNGLSRHLDILQRFHLFGDGLFAARLSRAMFDPDQADGGGRRRTGAVTGLRLHDREAWPPASSELRLALMGILSESLGTKSREQSPDLLECISFAIRDLSDDEMETCRDVDSIHALDFLRLQYRPPNPVLEAVISPKSLERYDRIFKFLLRLLRMQSIAQHLIREVTNRHQTAGKHRLDHLFRVHAQHFMTSIADYAISRAVGIPWRELEARVKKIERYLSKKDYEATVSQAGGLANLRKLHEDTLDTIMRGLHLKTKQADNMKLLESIFAIMLRFAASTRNEEETHDAETTRRLLDDLKTNIEAFVQLVGQNSVPYAFITRT